MNKIQASKACCTQGITVPVLTSLLCGVGIIILMLLTCRHYGPKI